MLVTRSLLRKLSCSRPGERHTNSSLILSLETFSEKPVDEVSLLRGVCFCASVLGVQWQISWGAEKEEAGAGLHLCSQGSWGSASDGRSRARHGSWAPAARCRTQLCEQLTVPSWLCTGSWENDQLLLSIFHFPVRPNLSTKFLSRVPPNRNFLTVCAVGQLDTEGLFWIEPMHWNWLLYILMQKAADFRTNIEFVVYF